MDQVQGNYGALKRNETGTRPAGEELDPNK
jgi:hypothetical protein